MNKILLCILAGMLYVVLFTLSATTFYNSFYKREVVVDNNSSGSVDRQELLQGHVCTAVFSGTLLKGEEVIVTQVSYEAGGIMEKWYVPKYGQYFYEESFKNLDC